MISSNQHTSDKLVGLLPAAGNAARLGPLPCSKEIFPIGMEPVGSTEQLRAKVAATGLLESMRFAGATQAFFVLRKGKWDIPSYYGHGGAVDMHLAYLMMDDPFGAPYTLDQAYPFIRNATILFGFPDILFRPKDAFIQLLTRQSQRKADLVLGGFKAENPSKMDMLVLDDQNRVCDIVIKPTVTHLTHTWILAVWTPAFSKYLHDYVARDRQQRIMKTVPKDGVELYVGDVIRAAIKDHWRVETLFFDLGTYLDVGTPEDMQRAMSDSTWTFGGEE